MDFDQYGFFHGILTQDLDSTMYAHAVHKVSAKIIKFVCKISIYIEKNVYIVYIDLYFFTSLSILPTPIGKYTCCKFSPPHHAKNSHIVRPFP